jgi:uncharacterized membrane protein
MVSDTLAYVTRAAHDLGLATWFGGSMFGKLAHNPSVKAISDPRERGKVVNAAWNGYNVINGVGLGAAAAGWAGARVTETNPARMSTTENVLSFAKDGLMVAAVATGIANGVQGARLARQAREGAVPVENGTEPAPETPAEAASIQRSLDVLGNVNLGVGAALIAVNAVLAQVNYSRPTARRALLRRSNTGGGLLGGDDRKAVSPFTLGALALAGLNEVARRSPLPTPTS